MNGRFLTPAMALLLVVGICWFTSFRLAIGQSPSTSQPAGVTTAPTQEEKDLFKEIAAANLPPDSLINAYAQYAKFAQAGDEDRLRDACLPGAVPIVHEARATSEEYGLVNEINLPFAKKGFSRQVLNLRKDNESVWLIRTSSTAIWFVETSKGGWKVYKVWDKPIE